MQHLCYKAHTPDKFLKKNWNILLLAPCSTTWNPSTTHPQALYQAVRAYCMLLGGSWAVISGLISKVTIVKTHTRGLITILITTHEHPSKPSPQAPCADEGQLAASQQIRHPRVQHGTSLHPAPLIREPKGALGRIGDYWVIYPS